MIALSLIAPVLFSASLVISDVQVEVGDGTMIDRATVVVESGRISRVIPGGAAVKAPEGSQRIDGKGKVLTPGLIDASSSLGVREVDLEPTAVDDSLKESDVMPAFRVVDGFHPHSVWLVTAREEGVTSAVVRPQGRLIHGTGSWVELTGRLDQLPDASKAAAMFGGVGIGAIDSEKGSRGGVWLRLRELVADVRYYAKNRAAMDQNRTRALSLSPVHLEAMIPVVEGRLPLVLEAYRASDIAAALRFAKEERLKLILAGAAEAWLLAPELARAKVPVILVPSDQVPETMEALRARDDSATILDAAGVDVMFSAPERGRHRLRQEAGIAVAYGMDRKRALRAICRTPAAAYGKESEVGTVAVGKRANLVLWSGDPLELSSVAELVLINGVQQSLEGRQRRLVERYMQPAKR